MNDDEFMPDEVRPGRRSRFRFTQTAQWALLLPGLSDAGYRAYSLLVAHVSTERDDVLVWPQQQSLGDMLGKRPEAISRVINRELVPLGLVDVDVKRYGLNNSRRRNVYTVHEEPPPGWEGYATIQEWYAANRPKTTKPAGQPGHAIFRVSGDAKNRASGHAKNRAGNKTKPELDETGEGQAPAARSAADARRASAGSSACERAEGGSAASGQDGSSSEGQGAPVGPDVPKQRAECPEDQELTGEQAARVKAIVASLPDALVALLPYGTLPKRNRRQFLESMGARTTEQIIDRAARRWEQHGYADALHSAEGKGIGSAVGVAMALVRAGECPHLRCEDGRDIDTGADCRVCAERRADRRAAKKAATAAGRNTGAVRQAPHRPGWWECTICHTPGKGQAPDDGECTRCQDEAAAAAQQLADRWAQEAAALEAEQQAATDLSADLDRQAEEHAAAQAEERTAQQQADAEETKRLRAELAEQFPELAAVSSSANPTSPPPF
ncbi:hypothetical protein [Streptomyces sp. NPDC015680]|uniref:hypothetical protein n=1 Tax=Streptomyces sp. NPDC015680 TaxID=3364962 RepID=UPI0036F8683E